MGKNLVTMRKVGVGDLKFRAQKHVYEVGKGDYT